MRWAAAWSRSLYDHAVRALPTRNWLDTGLAAVVTAATLTLAPALLPSATPGATAADCPQVQVVFARGRYEPAGPGVLGNAFINALQSKAGKTRTSVYTRSSTRPTPRWTSAPTT